MDDHIWQGLIDIAQKGHATMMAEGFVSIPQLFFFTNDRLAGHVQLRPIERGQDAREGIVKMSYIAAAAEADEVVAVWETLDIAVACEHEPKYGAPGLNLAWAVPGQHVLHRFAYAERRLPGRTEHGLSRTEPIWVSTPTVEEDGPLEPAIRAMLVFCWKPFDSDDPNFLKETSAVLRAEGYCVNFTV